MAPEGHTEVHALDETIVERYLRRHHSARFARPGDAAGLYRFLHMLREQGTTRRQKKPPLSSQQFIEDRTRQGVVIISKARQKSFTGQK